MYESLSDENRQKIKSLEKENVKIEFNEMTNALECVVDKIGNRLRADVFTLTIYFRLFIPVMFPQYNKAIYIDSDTVILEDVAKLYNEELGDNLIGAVIDESIAEVKPFAKYIEEVVGISKNRYINSGMLLLNMEKLRQTKIDERFLDLYNKYHLELIAPDQDYINFLCYGKIKYLSSEWDAMPTPGVAPMEKPSIVHYNLFAKPWHYDNVDYEEYFKEYVAKSLFSEDIQNVKNSYTDEDRKSDDEHLNLMLERANMLCSSENSFKKLYDAGVEQRL